MEHMSFKEFRNWCLERACDSCWGSLEAMASMHVIDIIHAIPFWKRKKKWKELYEKRVLDEIVNPTNEKISKLKEEAN